MASLDDFTGWPEDAGLGISKRPAVDRAAGIGGAKIVSRILLVLIGKNPFTKRPGFNRVCAALDGVVAQLVEHHNGIVGVRSSNLLGSTILKKGPRVLETSNVCRPFAISPTFCV